DLTSHAKDLLSKKIDDEIKTTHWIVLQNAITAVRASNGILSATAQSAALTKNRNHIDPMADMVYLSYGSTLDTVLDEFIATRAAATNIPDAQKKDLRDRLRTHLTGAGFSYDAAAFRSASVGTDSALIDKNYK